MGILNVTPDSFSDGGLYHDVEKAVDHALLMIEEGADIIDIGGESTRPFSDPVSEEDELSRVLPVIKKLCDKTDIAISIDTTKSYVARESCVVGANIINDIIASDEVAEVDLGNGMKARINPKNIAMWWGIDGKNFKRIRA